MRRSLVPYLFAALLFQVSFLTVRFAHALRPRASGHLSAADAAFAQVIRWRRSLCDPANDPPLRARAPALHLVSRTGVRFDGRALHGRRSVLLFASGGG
jgi:hypothetical protein